jgi:hypothetical protein
MTVGELVGYIDLEDQGFDRGLGQAEQRLRRLQSTTSSTTGRIESTVIDAFAKVADAIGDGMDPDEALADLARLVDGVDDTLTQVERRARDASDVIDEAIGDGAERGGGRFKKALSGAFDVAQAGLSGVMAVSKFATLGVAGLGLAALATAAAVAAIGGAITLGVAGLGVFLAANKQVKKEVAALGKEALTAFQKAAAPLRGPLLEGLERIQGKIKPFAKMLSGVFEKSAPLIEKAFDVALDVIDTLIERLPGIIDKGMPVAEFFLNTLGGAISGFFEFIDWGLGKIEEFKAAFNDSSTTLGGWAERIGGIVEQVKAFFGDVFSTVATWISENQGKITEWGAKLEEGWATASEAISSAIELITLLWEQFGDDILNALGILVDTFLGVWNGLWTTISGILDVAVGLLTGDMDRLKEGLEKIWNGLWEAVESILVGALDLIKNQIAAAWGFLESRTGVTWAMFKQAISDAIDNAISIIKGLPGQIKAGLGNIGTLLLQAGRDLIQGMINGIRAKAAELVTAAQGTVQSAVDGAKNLLGISSPSRVFEEIGKWTVAGLVRGLTDSKAQAVDVVTRMVDEIKTAFKSQPDVADGLIKFVQVGNDSLAALAKQREDLVARLAAAKEMAKKVAGDAAEWAALTGLKAEDFTGAGDMAGELSKKASAINNFANNINALAKRGLNKATIQQIIDAGVEKGATFAEMLVGSDGSEIKALNKAQAAVDKASKKLGKASADAMYDTGKKAGEGYLKGLQDSLKKLDKEMSKIVKALVAAIKKELKIKSPSQVMAEIGVNTMAGWIEGITSMAGAVVGAAQGVIGQAVSAAANGAASVAGSTPNLAGSNAVGNAGGQGGEGFSQKYGFAVGRGFGVMAEPMPAAGQGVNVNIDMSNSVVREEPDLDKIGNQVGFRILAAGLT